jgi:hypothetical protein
MVNYLFSYLPDQGKALSQRFARVHVHVTKILPISSTEV